MNATARYQIGGSTASQIAGSVEASVRSGRMGPGAQLPPIRALAATLRVSPGTVAAAYRDLRARGVVQTGGRRGTHIRLRPPLAAPARAAVPPGVRDLAGGGPDLALLPALDRGLSRLDPAPRGYEVGPVVPALLQLAAAALARDGIRSDSLTVVGGALDGVERLLQAHLSPGDRVAVEDPGYARVLDLLGAMSLEPVAVAVDDAGPVPAALAAALRRGVSAVIVTPRAQNPFGSALDQARASSLRRVLRADPGVLVVEDDHAGPVAGAPPQTLTTGRERWALVRSVSKALGPDLRLAVVAGDATTVARVEGRRLLGAGWVSTLLQDLVVDLQTDPAATRLLRRATVTYARRRRALLDALAARGIAAHGRSGYNVWIPVREEQAVVRGLLEAGWAVGAGERYRLAAPPAIRVTAATLEPAEAQRLATDLAALLRPGRRAVVA